MILRRYFWFSSFISPIIFLVLVVILGSITPGYDHFRDTISILAIKKYSWFQILNFIQLGLGLGTASFLFYHHLTQPNAKKVWLRIVIFCLVFLLIETFIPTDDISSGFSLNRLSLTGSVHLITLAVFFLSAPLGVYYLAKSLKTETLFSHFSQTTKIAGYTCSVLCYLWTFFLLTNSFNSILGIFQKIIALIFFSWFLQMLLLIRSSPNSPQPTTTNN